MSEIQKQIDEIKCPELKKLAEGLTKRKVLWYSQNETGTELFEVLKRLELGYSGPYMERIKFEIGGHKWSCIHGVGSYGGIHLIGKGKDEGLIEVLSDDYNDGDPIGHLTADYILSIVDMRIQRNEDSHGK